MVRPFNLARSSLFNKVLRFSLALRPSTLAPTGSQLLLKDGFELLDYKGGQRKLCVQLHAQCRSNVSFFAVIESQLPQEHRGAEQGGFRGKRRGLRRHRTVHIRGSDGSVCFLGDLGSHLVHDRAWKVSSPRLHCYMLMSLKTNTDSHALYHLFFLSTYP